MNGIDAGLIGFFISIIVYAVLAQRQVRLIETPWDFFHRSDYQPNVISWTAANITLGTGLFYILSGSYSTGLLFLATPVSVAIGYFILSWFTRDIVPANLWNDDNIIKAIGKELDGSKSNTIMSFAVLLSAIMILVYIFLLSFEIFVSSRFLSSVMFVSADRSYQIFVDIVVFLVALIYTMWGGFRAVVSTDKIQFIFIVGFTILIFLLLGFHHGEASAAASHSIIRFDGQTILAMFSAILAAISTQFYSILNWNAASQTSERDKLFRAVGILTALILGVFTVAGLIFSPAGDPLVQLDHIIGALGKSTHPISILTIVALSIGMSAVVFSTVDSLIISISKFAYENLPAVAHSHDSASSLSLIRRSIIVYFSISFLVLLMFWLIQPNIFMLLLTLVSGMDVIPPMIITLIVLARRKRLSFMGEPLVGKLKRYHLYFIMYLVTVCIAFTCLILYEKRIPLLGLISFAVSSVVSLIFIRAATKRRV